MWLKLGVILLTISIVTVIAGVAVSSDLSGAAVGAEANSQRGEEAGLPQLEEIELADRKFTLQTGIVNGRMAYVGVGGDIDGIVNPDLVVQSGEVVRVTLVNGDGIAHDLVIPDVNAATRMLIAKGDSADWLFAAAEDSRGDHAYYCSAAGHRQAGMEGRLIIR